MGSMPIFRACVLLLFGAASTWAHTTVLYPEREEGKTASLLVLHFHPAEGTDAMGIRLGADDTETVKGLESLYMIHKGRRLDLSAGAMPFLFSAGGTSATQYRLRLDGTAGYRGAGDYCVVAKHIPHWKPGLGIYIQKVTKFFLNKGGRITDWPERILSDMPEIIPLVEPFGLRPGALFRGEVVDDHGQPISHATISIEYLNHALVGDALVSAPTVPGAVRTSRIVRADRDGSFSFIPTHGGSWTLTLVDGDDQVFIDGKELRFDSSLSLMVQ